MVEGNGWMADGPEDVVLFHFLHGDSDQGDRGDAINSSGDWLKNSELYQNMLKSGATNGESAEDLAKPLMEVFYGNDTTPNKRHLALERSRKKERKEFLIGMNCGVIAETPDGERPYDLDGDGMDDSMTQADIDRYLAWDDMLKKKKGIGKGKDVPEFLFSYSLLAVPEPVQATRKATLVSPERRKKK